MSRSATELAGRLSALHDLREEIAHLKAEADDLEQEIARAWPWTDGAPEMIEVPGVGLAMRHGGKKRTEWDTESLRRIVLDTVIANDDGERIEETELDKVLMVWNLGAPRVTALKKRKINADEFCKVEIGNPKVEIRGG